MLLVASVAVSLTLLAGLAARRACRRRKARAAPGPPPRARAAAPRRPEVECHGPVIAGDPSRLRPDSEPPGYWRHQDVSKEVLARVDVSMDVRQAMQQLLDSTFKRVTTRDRRGGPMPARLRVRQVQRIENSGVWRHYARERHGIKSKRPFRCTPVSAVMGDGLRTQAGCGGGCAPEDRCAAAANSPPPESLRRGVNEVYLWHGTSPERALKILKAGFQLKCAGSGAGSSMYGDGIYLAECSSKADEYAGGDSEEYTGVCCLLLCRVVLGEVLKMTTGGEATHAMIKAAMNSGAYDSVLGDREVSVGTYREFVVYKEAQVYPEYLVLYTRDADTTSATVSVDPGPPHEPPESAHTRRSSGTGGVVPGAAAEGRELCEL